MNVNGTHANGHAANGSAGLASKSAGNEKAKPRLKIKRKLVKPVVRARPQRNRNFETDLSPANSPLDRVLSKLHGVERQSNGQYAACCPAHSDSNASLSVKADEHGNVVFNCYSGCDRAEITKALGFSESDLRTAGRKVATPGPNATSLASLECSAPNAAESATNAVCTVKLMEGDAPASQKAWNKLQQTYMRQLVDQALGDFSSKLGISEASLKLLGAGLRANANHKALTFPERNGDGQICGISTRRFDGTKRQIEESRRGLTIPGEMTFAPGDVLFLVEGPTDVAAMQDMGLHAVGRPSNVGGIDELTRYLSKVPGNVEIVVVGENDLKPDGKWPGRDGAEQTADKLAETLLRPVRWSLVPHGVKDSRSWLNKQGGVITKPRHKLGKKFKRLLLRKAETIQPEALTRFSPMHLSDFAKRDFKRAWMVKDILVANELAVIGGPKKSLKTTIALDLAISLATASPFLNKFEVTRKHRVLMFSGESGGATLQEAIRRVRERTKDDIANADIPFHLNLDLPRLSDPLDLKALSLTIRQLQSEVVIFDPLYLSLLAGNKGTDASNMYQMGPLLAAIASTCLQAGATPIFVHHTKKSSNRERQSLDLDDLSFSGVAEIARQWILLKHRKPYAGDGRHELEMSIGGSAGQSGNYCLSIDEGRMQDDFSGRKWDVQVVNLADAIKHEKDEKQQAKVVQGDDMARQKIVDLLKEPLFCQGATLADINKHTKLSQPLRDKTIQSLLDRGFLKTCKIIKPAGPGKREYDGYLLVGVKRRLKTKRKLKLSLNAQP